MDINAINTLIGSIGFPCAMCVIMSYIIYKMNVQHNEEMNTLKDSLNNNTLAIQHLTDIITSGGNKK